MQEGLLTALQISKVWSENLKNKLGESLKGSITINGTSLTINQTKDDIFDVNLIPYTLQTTTLGSLSAGDLVNIEIDQVARYVERIMQIQA